jgi:Transposase DDE domain
MRRKLQTKVGAAIYSRRKTIVEPVFGQIKQARGFRQFLLRGLEKVQGEYPVQKPPNRRKPGLARKGCYFEMVGSPQVPIFERGNYLLVMG